MTDKTNWTDEQLRVIEGWLKDKWGQDKSCGQCGKIEWSIGPAPAILSTTDIDGRMFLGGGYPCVVVICQNCGNTIMVNAFVSRLQPPPVEKEAGNA